MSRRLRPVSRRRRSSICCSPTSHSTQTEPTIAAEHRAALDSVGAADIVPAELAALDLLAQPDGATDAVVTTPPCLARSGDALIRWEARQPGRIQPPASEMFAARLASSLWFRWSTSTMAAPQSAAAGDDPSAAIGQLARAAVSVEALERIRNSATDDAGLHRLLTHVIDGAHIRQMQPADIVEQHRDAGADRGDRNAGRGADPRSGADRSAVASTSPRPAPHGRRVGGRLALVAAFVVWTLFGGDSAVHAVDDRAAAAPGELIVIDVLANDSGGQGGLFITEVTPPTQGSIGLAGNGITYTAEPGASGVDSFGYQITDGSGSSATATVFVDIVGTATTSTTTTTSSTSTSIAAPANQVPLAGDDAATGARTNRSRSTCRATIRIPTVTRSS